MAGIDVAAVGVLSIASSRTPIISAHFTDNDGNSREWNPVAQKGPTLFEDTTYHLYIAGYEHPPHVRHRDPLFTQDLSTHDRQRVCTGTFNFKRQIGRAEIRIHVGRETLDLRLEVVPTKIDYATDYRELLTEVEAGARGLALAYLRSTHQRAGRSDQRGTEVEWLTILRQETEGLQLAVERINRYPHRHLSREITNRPIHQLKRPDAITRRAVLRGKGAGGFDYAASLGPVRQIIPSVVAQGTLDTPEHRWIALQLSEVRHRLRDILTRLEREKRSSRPGLMSLRRLAERSEVDGLLRRVEQMLKTKCLAASSRMPQPNPPSLTLLSSTGYRESYEILNSLRLGLDLEGHALQLQTKDIHELYEIWCFLEIVRIVTDVTDSDSDPSSLIGHYASGLRIGLRAGSRSDINLPNGPRLLTLSYNRTYPGQTGDQRPDIVLRIQASSRPDLIIVLDAKYRVDATGQFRARYGSAGPPIDAINALHRYRDAIVTKDSGAIKRRPVVRGAALFPLTAEETKTYEGSALYRSLDSLGIGALPFLPGNTDFVRNWLAGLLSLPRPQLAWNGPPGPWPSTRPDERSVGPEVVP